MSSENRYCCRCHRTTRFQVQGASYTCTGCGVVIEVAPRQEPRGSERSLIGDPMRYKTSFAA
jgi:hypothetical protein